MRYVYLNVVPNCIFWSIPDALIEVPFVSVAGYGGGWVGSRVNGAK